MSSVRKLLSITVAAPSRQKGPMNRHLAAVLNADVVGYSRLMSADEAGTLQLLKTHEIGVIEPAVAKHNRRIVKRMGDGYLAEFASVVDAVECALDWQTQTAGSDRLKFRIGVHLGDIIAEGRISTERVSTSPRGWKRCPSRATSPSPMMPSGRCAIASTLNSTILASTKSKTFRVR